MITELTFLSEIPLNLL